jgi:hypothetical protein
MKLFNLLMVLFLVVGCTGENKTNPPGSPKKDSGKNNGGNDTGLNPQQVLRTDSEGGELTSLECPSLGQPLLGPDSIRGQKVGEAILSIALKNARVFEGKSPAETLALYRTCIRSKLSQNLE